MSDVISKSLIATIISDPKQFVSQVSKLDPVELKKIIEPLENLIETSMARQNYLTDTLERIKGESLDTAEHVANASTAVTDAHGVVTEAKHVVTNAAEDLDVKRSELVAAQATYKAKIEDLNFFKVNYDKEMFLLNADMKIIHETIIKLKELSDQDEILLPILKNMLSEKYERAQVLNNTLEEIKLETLECGIAVINATTAVTDAEAVVTEGEFVLSVARISLFSKQSALDVANSTHSAKIEERNIAQREYDDEFPLLNEEQLVLSNVVTALEQLHGKHTKTPTLSPTLTPTTLTPTLSPTSEYIVVTSATTPTEGYEDIMDNVDCTKAAVALQLVPEGTGPAHVQNESDRPYGCRMQTFGSPMWLNTRKNSPTSPSSVHKVIRRRIKGKQ